MTSSKPSGTQTVTQNTSPWSGQQPYLQDVFSQAQTNFNKGPLPFYPQSTVVPLSGQTESALNTAQQRATDPGSLIGQAQSQLGQTINGDYLNAGNPYFDQMASRIREQVLPAVNSSFSNKGRYGSGANIRTATTALGDSIGNLAGQQYGQERQNQLNSLMQAPGLQTADTNILQQVGAQREAQTGKQLEADISKYYYPQNAQNDALAQYASLVGGGNYGGSTTSQQPIYSNSLLTGLGAGASGLGGLLSLGRILPFGMIP